MFFFKIFIKTIFLKLIVNIVDNIHLYISWVAMGLKKTDFLCYFAFVLDITLSKVIVNINATNRE